MVEELHTQYSKLEKKAKNISKNGVSSTFQLHSVKGATAERFRVVTKGVGVVYK